MGVGYILGCVLSILLWKLDREKFYMKMDTALNRGLKSPLIKLLTYLFLVLAFCVLLKEIPSKEVADFITMFVVIDISSTERKNLLHTDHIHFYDSISTISRSVVCGFIAPLFYIVLFGNYGGIVYSFMYYTAEIKGYKLLKYIHLLLSVLPAFIADLLLYIIYILRNKELRIDFRGDYLLNCFIRPLLNVDILAANVESIHFYYYYYRSDGQFMKSYGQANKKIDAVCIRDYLSIGYGISMVTFICFFILINII